jgi:hypothetical protein
MPVILPSPIPELWHAPLTPKCYKPKNMARFLALLLFLFQTHIWVYQRTWERVTWCFWSSWSWSSWYQFNDLGWWFWSSLSQFDVFCLWSRCLCFQLSMSIIHNFNPLDLNFISCVTILMFMFFTLNTKSPQFAPFFSIWLFWLMILILLILFW